MPSAGSTLVAAGPPPANVAAKRPRAAPQRFDIKIGRTGYEPSTIVAAPGRPITLTVGKGEGCAAGFLIPSLGVSKDNSSGKVAIRLGALKPGTYVFSCGMDMVRGNLVVR